MPPCRSATYAQNLLNQYTSRQVPSGVDIMGFAPADTSPVKVNNSPADYRWERFFQELVNVSNSAGAQFTTFDIDYDNTSPADEQRWVFLPQTPEIFSYDADGNLTQDGRWNYEWDGENRLRAVETRTGLPSTVELRRYEYTYDYMSRRSAKSRFTYIGSMGGGNNLMGGPGLGDSVQNGSSSSMTEIEEEEGGTPPSNSNSNQAPIVNWEEDYRLCFVWDGWNLMDELEWGTDHIRGYAWGLDMSGSLQGAGGVGGLLWEQVKGSAPLHAFTDGNGNITSVRDDDSMEAASYTYGPFGETLAFDGSNFGENPIRFSSKYSDEETGLVYYGYRYYSPGAGRWVGRDPAGEAVSPTVYSFVSNAPPNDIEFLGLWRWAKGNRGGGQRADMWPDDNGCDSIRTAAVFAGMDSREPEKWLYNESDHKWVESTDIISSCKVYSVPNTIYAVTGDLGTSIWKGNVKFGLGGLLGRPAAISEMNNYAEHRRRDGFYVVVQEDTTKQQLLRFASYEWTSGIFITAHGDHGFIRMEYEMSNPAVGPDSPYTLLGGRQLQNGVHHKMNEVVLFVCWAGEDPDWVKSVSNNGILRADTNKVFPTIENWYCLPEEHGH